MKVVVSYTGYSDKKKTTSGAGFWNGKREAAHIRQNASQHLMDILRSTGCTYDEAWNVFENEMRTRMRTGG